jgi:hypothetical protein
MVSVRWRGGFRLLMTRRQAVETMETGGDDCAFYCFFAAPSVFGANIVKIIEKKKLWRGKIEGVAFGEKLIKN